MESDKNKKREKVIHDFSKYPELARQFLADEKKAREAIRKKEEFNIKTEIPKEIDEVLKEVEAA